MPTMTYTKVIECLEGFISLGQIRAMIAGCRGEEGPFFREKLMEYTERIETMPKTYETDGQGDAAIAHLHYFTGACDWYITEKDSDPDSEGQVQAFGYANFGDSQCAELGYINIKELCEVGAELDLYWTPKPLATIKEKPL